MIYRTRLGLRALPATLLALPAIAAAPAAAAPAAVTLRVEGATKTIYENRVTTDGHAVTTASGGTHHCDGTNGGVNPTPGPSATSALDDGAKLGGFTWDGTYDQGFDDYFVSRIGPDSQTQTQFWALLVDSEFSQVGGCQQRVKSGEEVLWAFDGFSKQHVLRLSGPASATTDRSFSVRVTDGQDGSPQAGAGVGGTLTGADGRASLSFSRSGIYRLKAQRVDSIRSNVLAVCVDPAGADPCTSFDRVAPTIRLLLRGMFASDTSRSRTVTIAWQGDDRADGSGITTYDVDLRQVAAGARGAGAGDWRPLVDGTVLTSARFRGEPGGAYEFRVSAFDRARNRSRPALGRVIVPVDDRDRALLRLTRGWRRLKRTGAYGRSVIRSRRKGAAARFDFHGRRVAVIGRRLRRGGRLRVTVDGRSRVLRLRGRPRFRRVLYVTAPRSSGRHTLRLKAVGGGPVEIDAVAPIP